MADQQDVSIEEGRPPPPPHTSSSGTPPGLAWERWLRGVTADMVSLQRALPPVVRGPCLDGQAGLWVPQEQDWAWPTAPALRAWLHSAHMSSVH